MLDSEARIAARLGATVRRERKARAWSQETLAERVDVSLEYVGLLERGKRLPSVGVLIRIADVFGATIGELLGEPREDPWVEEALALLRAVPLGAREPAMAMLRGLVVVSEPETDQRPRIRRRR